MSTPHAFVRTHPAVGGDPNWRRYDITLGYTRKGRPPRLILTDPTETGAQADLPPFVLPVYDGPLDRAQFVLPTEPACNTLFGEVCASPNLGTLLTALQPGASLTYGRTVLNRMNDAELAKFDGVRLTMGISMYPANC